ncbi:MAG: hypothetical protein WC873_04695 [Candidatus Gracilibacteria bacterium]
MFGEVFVKAGTAWEKRVCGDDQTVGMRVSVFGQFFKRADTINLLVDIDAEDMRVIDFEFHRF